MIVCIDDEGAGDSEMVRLRLYMLEGGMVSVDMGCVCHWLEENISATKTEITRCVNDIGQS